MIPFVLRSSGRPRRAVVAGAVASLLAIAGLPPVAAVSPDPYIGGGLFNQNQVLTYRWGGPPPSAMQAAINRGVADANGTRASKAPSFAYSATGANTVYYGLSVPCGINGLACMRRTAPTSFGVWFRENGHRFDWGTLSWCELSGSPNGCYDAENVTLDELGHVMGLDHHVNAANDSDYTDAVVQTYSRTKPTAGWNAHAYGRCDVATLQQLYDVPSPTTLYSTCLDVPTKLTLTASSTWAPYGSTVTFGATLGSAGTGRLADNAIGSRVVVLQMLGSSGWFDIATLSAGGGGSYAMTRSMWASASYRAVFRKPAGEGLRSSSSSSVTVTVSAACPGGVCPLSASVAAN